MNTQDISNKQSAPSEVVSRPDLVAAANGGKGPTQQPEGSAQVESSPGNVTPIGKAKTKKERRAERKAAEEAKAREIEKNKNKGKNKDKTARAPRKGSYANDLDEAIKLYAKQGKREMNAAKLMDKVRDDAKRLGKKPYTMSQLKSHLSFRQTRGQLKEYALA